jgi:exoribonuclease-2
MRGHSSEITPVRLHQLPGVLPRDLAGSTEQADYMLKLYEESLAESEAVPVEEIWTFVVDESSGLTNAELCELYYGENELKKHLSLRLALISDAVFFKRKKELFIPRPAEVVEELKKAAAVKIQKENLRNLTVETFAARLKDETHNIPDEIYPNIELLEAAAASRPGRDNSQQKEVKELMSVLEENLDLSLQGSIEKKAYYLLMKIGWFDFYTNLAIIRHRFPVINSEEALKDAALISCSDDLEHYRNKEKREDFTDAHTITVDDETTRDMDDAVSLKENPAGGWQLGVHITDVASAIKHGSALDLDSRERATSLYLAEDTYHMLPRELAEDKLSLVEGKFRPCLSCIFEIDTDYNITAAEIKRTVIKVDERLSYNAADRFLEEGHQVLDVVYQIAARREIQRMEDGAIKVNKREAFVTLGPRRQINLIEMDENSPAHVMIGELMLLVNKTIAEYAMNNGLPMIFRGQEKPEQDMDTVSLGIPDGPAKDFSMRVNLKPSSSSCEPVHHASLALNAYVQATSPIRRYSDLLNQRQIATFIEKGSCALTLEELDSLRPLVDENLRTGMLISRETRRYWLLRYLQQQVKHSNAITGTVVRNDLKFPLVELDVVYFTAIVKTQEVLQLGQRVDLKISAVDPLGDYIKVELADS